MSYLTGQGYTVSTYIDDLYPYHPIYSPTAFDRDRAGGSPSSSVPTSSTTRTTRPTWCGGRSACASTSPRHPWRCCERNLAARGRRRQAAAQLRDRDRGRRDGAPGAGPAPAGDRAARGANPDLRPLVGLPGVRLRPHLRRQRARRVRGGARGPLHQEGRAHPVEAGRGHRRERRGRPPDEPTRPGARRPLRTGLRQALAAGERCPGRCHRQTTTSSTSGTASR